MKHLTKIQLEFVKYAANWDELSYELQKSYLQRHPKSRRRLTAKPEVESSKVDKIINQLKSNKSQVRQIAFLEGLCGNVVTSLIKLLPGSKPYGVIAYTEDGKKHLIHAVTKYKNKFIDARGELDLSHWQKAKYDASSNKLPKIKKLFVLPVRKKKLNDSDWGSGLYYSINGVIGAADAQFDHEVHGYIKETLKQKT